MSQTAAHLVDHVIPHMPLRQWVLPLPIPLRVLLAAQLTKRYPHSSVLRWLQGCRRSAATFIGSLDFLLSCSNL
jgi:hypothetical protein